MLVFQSLLKDYDDCELEIIKSIINLQKSIITSVAFLPSLWVLRGIDKMIEQSKEIITSHVEVETAVPEREIYR